MQNAKDTFYISLRDRLAAVAPQRAITLRAVQRPALYVEDAEAPKGELPNDCFVLRWVDESVVSTGCGTLVRMTCSVMYASSGSQTNAGLDRGRAVSGMDALLLAITEPLSALKMNYTTTPPTVLQTNVFWTTPSFGALNTVRDQLTRTATTTVYCYQEPGEQ